MNNFLILQQIMVAINAMSEDNKDLLEKYRKEVALRRKYHEQLVELKGRQYSPFFRHIFLSKMLNLKQVFILFHKVISVCCAV